MLQFTRERIAAFKNRAAAHPNAISCLKNSIREVRDYFLIPPNKAATWSGFYACPEHSVKLAFDIASPSRHRCPEDGKMITGDIFDGAWWRIVNEKNQQACYHAALLYLLEEKAEDFELARRYLIAYANVYPDYEIHGGIPYNNPGKANAQTLCDAAWVKGLLLAYDIVRNRLEHAEREMIEQRLFRCCAEFLMEYRSNQIHNHEVVVDSALAMIGLVLDDKRYIGFGLDAEFGLKYQLRHGVLADGLWFEGTPGYHFYAMEQYVYFEMLACNTEYSFFNDSAFLETLKFPLNLLQPDGSLPPLNDAGFGYCGFTNAESIYELAWRETEDAVFLKLLRCVYAQKKRDNVWSFFYGAETLPDALPPEPSPYHGGKTGESGITTMLGPDGRFLLVKHSPFGGEHDHYDRLGIHFMGFGKSIIPDIGTCLYGAPLHYAYYKNTPAHNTVCINGQNQPPACCTVYAYDRGDSRTVLDVGVKWDGTYIPMNTFVIPQWSAEDYAGAEFRRYIAWYDEFFADIFK
ncbi:MAG: heparinase II/III-family protein, partial [Clostridiales bacterium]|nr:heparinase II/III-family protein [Clostridiales bacterium]